MIAQRMPDFPVKEYDIPLSRENIIYFTKVHEYAKVLNVKFSEDEATKKGQR